MMNKQKVFIPKGTRYISDLSGYRIPEGKCIIDKKVCGCGYTQFCLTNYEDVILCSPRLTLLQNKFNQNPQCYYFRPIKISKKEIKANGLITEDDINQYCYITQVNELRSYIEWRRSSLKPLKLMVTYDSLPKLISILGALGENIQQKKIVVDEFQLIFTDARFKAEVELDFVTYLNTYCNNVAYLSSTPMLDNYLSQLPEFSNLDYYEFIWDDSRISLPKINHIKTDNLEKSALEIIDMYRSGNGPTKIVDGKVYKSTEAILYINNVSMLTSIIKNSKLTPDLVNIITAQTPENKRKIKKCGKGFDFGEPPIKGEPCKLITLCTSTAFCGIDMYNTSAKSYVFSDCNLKTMAIDISLELPQIVGRQRLSSNVFRYDVTLYYLEDLRSKSKEEFEKEIEFKNQKTFNKIDNFNYLAQGGKDIDGQREILRRDAKNFQYYEDYCSIDKLTGKPILNKLVRLSDIRAWELQHYIYNNDFTVLRVLEDIGQVNKEFTLSVILEKIASEPYFEDRMRILSDYIKSNKSEIQYLPEKYRKYFESLSIQDMLDCGFRKSNLEEKIKVKRIKNIVFDKNSRISQEVYSVFTENEVYTKKEIKSMLGTIFQKYNYKAKASDIQKYFNVSRVRIKNINTGKYDEGYKLISKKI